MEAAEEVTGAQGKLCLCDHDSVPAATLATALTQLGETPVGAQPSTDKQLLSFHAFLIHPYAKYYPLYCWR